MAPRFGLLIVIISLIVGYLGSGGKMGVLFQPFEWLEILGIAIGTFMISNTRDIQKTILQNLKKILKTSPYTKDEYIEFLLLLFRFLKYAGASSAALEVERHIDHPKQSIFFKKLYTMTNGEMLAHYFCDYYRIILMGFNKNHDLEIAMDRHIEAKRHDVYKFSDAILRLGDAMPALGIIVAVLGVITAMGAVGSEPAILGARIASALIGTFIGVFLSYGLITPIGFFLQRFCLEELALYEAIKTVIISHANGDAPIISIEFARQALPEHSKPSFDELEKKVIAIK